MEGQGGEVWRRLSGPTAKQPGLLILPWAGSRSLRRGGGGRLLGCLEEPGALLVNRHSRCAHAFHFLLKYWFLFFFFFPFFFLL